MLLASCSRRGRFPESDPLSGQSESWPDRGAPERPTRLVAKVERREAQRPTSLGARGLIVPREGGPLIPPQGVPRKHSGASRRSIALAHFARDRQSSDALRRENANACWPSGSARQKNCCRAVAQVSGGAYRSHRG